MNSIQTFFFLICLLCIACNPKGKSKTNDCLKLKIEAFAKDGCKTGSSVKEYNLAGKHVFAFDPGNCGADMTTEVVNEKCQNLGYLGGISGNKFIHGTNFNQAEFVKTLWESPAY